MVNLELDGPRDLFPEFKDKTSYAERRDYVLSVMQKKVRDGDFYLSEMMCQPPLVVNVVGDICLGYSIDRSGTQEIVQKEYDIESLKIRIKCIKPFRYKVGYKRVRRPWHRFSNTINYSEPVYNDFSGTEDFPPSVAWGIIKKFGKYVKKAAGKARQNDLWRAEEVPPWSIVGDKRKSKRSKGSTEEVREPA